MNIGPDTIVALDIELWDLWGNLLQRSEAPVRYLHGGYDNIFAAVEASLEGKRVGDKVDVRLEPEDAFGEYDESLVRLEPLSRFPEGVEVGMQFEGIPGEESEGDGAIYTVTDVAEGQVVLDSNHPYAGISLKFICVVREVRPATAEEIERGYAEDPESAIFTVVH